MSLTNIINEALADADASAVEIANRKQALAELNALLNAADTIAAGGMSIVEIGQRLNTSGLEEGRIAVITADVAVLVSESMYDIAQEQAVALGLVGEAEEVIASDDTANDSGEPIPEGTVISETDAPAEEPAAETAEIPSEEPPADDGSTTDAPVSEG